MVAKMAIGSLESEIVLRLTYWSPTRLCRCAVGAMKFERFESEHEKGCQGWPVAIRHWPPEGAF